MSGGIICNPYGSLIADIYFDKVVATVVSGTVTKYTYSRKQTDGTSVTQCVVTVTVDGSGNFVSAERTNT